MDKNELHIKKPGFITPKNYFDSIDSQIIDRIALDSSVSNKNPFEIPENYFKELNCRLQNNLSKKNSQPKIISIFRNKTFRYVAGIAAILVIFISIFKFQKTNPSESSTISQIENYIENGFLDISYLDLEVLFTDEMLEDTSFISTIDDEELFDYLSYEIDETHLTNQ